MSEVDFRNQKMCQKFLYQNYFCSLKMSNTALIAYRESVCYKFSCNFYFENISVISEFSGKKYADGVFA